MVIVQTEPGIDHHVDGQARGRSRVQRLDRRSYRSRESQEQSKRAGTGIANILMTG